MRVLVDEMYPAGVVEALREIDIEATTVAALGLASASDAEVFGAAAAGGYAVLTENVSDFVRIAAEPGSAEGSWMMGARAPSQAGFGAHPQGDPLGCLERPDGDGDSRGQRRETRWTRAGHSIAGGHHPGLLIALSSRFSRRPAGLPGLIAALEAVADDDLQDRIVYLQRVDR